MLSSIAENNWSKKPSPFVAKLYADRFQPKQCTTAGSRFGRSTTLSQIACASTLQQLWLHAERYMQLLSYYIMRCGKWDISLKYTK